MWFKRSDCKNHGRNNKSNQTVVRRSKKGITTFIEVILNQELGEPFRRDAMKKPVQVAGINKSDMKPQKNYLGCDNLIIFQIRIESFASLKSGLELFFQEQYPFFSLF